MLSLFEKKYSEYVTIYKVPIGPNQLDPMVFHWPETGEEPKLNQSIHSQIIRDLEQLVGDQEYRIKNYYLVGPATNPGTKNKTGELRVLVQLNKDVLDQDIEGLMAERILKATKQLSNKIAAGTARKIVYMPIVRPIEKYDNYVGIYDILKSNWVKLPSGVTR